VDPVPTDLRKFNENEEIKLEQAPKKRRNKFWYAAIPTALIVISVFLVYLFSENPESYKIKAGIAALKAERFKEAVDLFKEVFAQDSSSKSQISNAYAQALEGRASEILITHPEEAEALLQKAVELNPGSKDVYLKLGLLHVKNKNYSKAVEYYEKAAGLDPQFAKTFFNLGYVYVKIKHYTEAKRMYLRVVELAPSFVDEALFNLAMINEKLGERKACMKNLKQAVAANPENEMAKQYLRRLTAKGEFLNEQ
jgi:tetratricopeptide (TPR) repeat protein